MPYISSVSGHVGIPGIPQASYAASKQSLSGLTKELAVRWGAARHPCEHARARILPQRDHERPVRRRTLGRLAEAQHAASRRRPPGDFTGAIPRLASDAGRYVTGQRIVIDGGWTAR